MYLGPSIQPSCEAAAVFKPKVFNEAAEAADAFKPKVFNEAAEAAGVFKPKARLCEPWVTMVKSL